MARICYEPKTFRWDSLRRIDQANTIIAEYEAQGFVLTLRQLYYQFVARDLIRNRQQEYKRLGALVNDARLAGLIDWEAIEDRTRWLRKSPHWESPRAIVDVCAEQFAVDKWGSQSCRPEVWIEKDALVGVIEGVCGELDVPYFAARGYNSASEMWRAAQRYRQHAENGQDPVLFHLGDHDPSGLDATRDIRARMKTFGVEVRVVRLALNWDQVEEYDPPPNPANLDDSRSKGPNGYVARFGNESWELDALAPPTIAGLIRAAIEELIGRRAWSRALRQEKKGRSQLRAVADNWKLAVESVDGKKS